MEMSSESTIRDIVSQYPQTRSVFDRYGLKGCGGPEGPSESVYFFARAHGVDLESLLSELKDAIANPSVLPSTERSTAADTIYRRFFKAAIITMLSAGGLWGAFLLLVIGTKEDFTSVSIFDVNAHGHAQIFGWVGLFVMGFAYQAFPRFKHTSLWKPKMALATFYMMLAGIILRVVGETFHTYSPMTSLAVVGGLIELSAITLFIINIVETYRRSGKPLEHYDYYVAVALCWFFAQSVLDIFHLYMTTTATTMEALLMQVATWQPPLRNFQVHGFALTMILGVSQRFFPGMFGLPEIRKRRSLLILITLTVAVFGEAMSTVALMKTGQVTFVGFMYASVILLAASIVALTRPWWSYLWGRQRKSDSEAETEQSDRSFKFFRAAYGWLYFSLGLLLFGPFYNFLMNQEFSHAFSGAVRHAITVGFVSLMIVGVSAKVVPILNGVDSRVLTRLWLPFALINTGCALRVSTQIITELYPSAYSVIGLSGAFEVAGFIIWGHELWKVMAMWKVISRSAKTTRLLAQIGPDDIVGSVVEAAPQLREIFARFGFTAISNPVLLRTVARATTIHRACMMQGVDESAFLQALNAALNVGPRLVQLTAQPTDHQ